MFGFSEENPFLIGSYERQAKIPSPEGENSSVKKQKHDINV
jgi:hypothetical protein